MLLFASCSKDDPATPVEEEKMATLSFGAVVNDLAKSQLGLKQVSAGIPECSDAEPAYVAVVLSGTTAVGTMEDPLFVDVNPNPGDYDNDGDDEYFTMESPDLELEPGSYSLDFFAVYDADDNLIWLAPAAGAELGDWTLPLEFDLGAGVKKYLDVNVLCYDDRLVNLYGYLFFDLHPTEVIEFCLFGNVCDENGRHMPANFRFDVWTYSGNAADPYGIPLFDANDPFINNVGVNDDGDEFADPLCVFLPDSAGEDVYYGELYLIENGTSTMIRSGEFTDGDVRDLFNGDDAVDYYHFREGDCNMEDSPALFEENGNGGGEQPGECDPNNPNADCDNDGVVNSNDDCPSTPPGVDVNARGCDDVRLPGQDVVVFNDVNIFDAGALLDEDNVQLLQNLVNFTTSGDRNDGNTVLLDLGRNSQCYGDGQCDDTFWNPFRSVITAEGFNVENNYADTGYLENIDEDIKVIFLVVPTIDYTVAEINELKSFAAEGGRIVFIGEHDQYYNYISVENQFLLNMGAVLHNTGGALDCGRTVIPSSSNSDHPIMSGIDEITMACASVIEPGPNDFVLWYDTSGSFALAGVARIDTTPITDFRAANASKKAAGPSEQLSDPRSTTGF